MYTATIQVSDPGRVVEKAFVAEDHAIKGKAQYRVTHKGRATVFEIQAQDSIALRTVQNSITKMLTVIEKMKGHHV
jgi:tRNA threonylcarbamoyladenosine modification (KEOPS) complex  Pcc1 subunit